MVAVLVAGCTSPDARIRQNPAFFNSLDPEAQELIRQGKVAIGFNKEMVRLAVGDPDRVWQRTDREGSSEAWSYTTYESDLGMPLFRGYYHRYYGPYWGPDVYYPYYTSFRGRRDREVYRIVFTGDQVSSIEQTTSR